MKILIYGIGNPGRQDDGLGALLVEEIRRATQGASGADHQFSFDANYQLNIEDAEAISRHDIVVFADASLGADDDAADGVTDDGGPFRLYPIGPEPAASFSTHSVSPGGIVALCSELYDVRPRTYMLAIRGYEWGFNEPMSEDARRGLDAAVQFLLGALRSPNGDDRPDSHSLLDRFVS